MITVVAAAIVQGWTVYALPAPKRHHDIIRYLVEVVGLQPPIRGGQGFLLSDGTFADRVRAMQVACEANQVSKEIQAVYEAKNGNLGDGAILFSEDLW